jgi:hypothetical protein
MSDPCEILQKLRCNEKALETLTLLCNEQSCSPDDIETNVLSVLSGYGLVTFTKLPLAPIPPSRIIKRVYRCVLTDLGEDVCSALLEK